MTTLSQVRATKIAEVKRRPPAVVRPTTPMGEVVAEIRKMNRGSVLIVDDGSVVGIFTERDLMTRINHTGDWQSTPVAEVMTERPVTIRPDQTIADAVNLMVVGGYRHLPLVDEGSLIGLLSIRDLLRYIVLFFPKEFLNQPSDPSGEPSSPWGG
jgi:CBS domain-containing protein